MDEEAIVTGTVALGSMVSAVSVVFLIGSALTLGKWRKSYWRVILALACCDLAVAIAFVPLPLLVFVFVLVKVILQSFFFFLFIPSWSCDVNMAIIILISFSTLFILSSIFFRNT